MGSFDNVIAINQEDEELNTEAIEQASKRVIPTVEFYLKNAPNAVKDYLVPWGYKLDPTKGIEKTGDKGGIISPYIVLIKHIIKDVDKIDPSTIEIDIFNTLNQTWMDIDQEFKIVEISSGLTWKIEHEDVALTDKQRKDIAEFIHLMFVANIGRIQKVPLVRQVGYNKELGKFLPSNDVKAKIKVGRGTIAEDFVKAITSDRQNSSKETCFNIINEMKQFPKFLICLAGNVASPLQAWNSQEEGTGIDMYAPSSSGKTAVQTTASNIIWGPIGNQKKWADTSASTFEIMQFGNGVPFILDDTHQIRYSDLDIPHLITDGKGRNKMVETSQAGFKLWATMKSRSHFQVVFFNGEVPLVGKVAQGSTGIKGRVFQLVGQPFDTKDGKFLALPQATRRKQIENWKSQASQKGGYFINHWMDHINKSITRSQFITEVDKISERLSEGLTLNDMQGRLITKAAILSFSLAEFGRHFEIELDIAAMEEELIKAITESGDVARNSDMMLNKIKEFITEHIKFNNDVYVAGTEKRGQYLNYDNMAIFGVKDRFLAISNKLLAEIFADTGRNESSKQAINLMKVDGFLILDKDGSATAQYKRLKIEGIDGYNDNSKFTGIKINWVHVADWFEIE